MIDFLFRLAFAVMCGIGAVAAALWVLVLMPAWLRERKLAKQAAAIREQKHRARVGRRRATAEAAAEKTRNEAGVRKLFMTYATPDPRRQERERQVAGDGNDPIQTSSEPETAGRRGGALGSDRDRINNSKEMGEL
jgi:hypothetical protein